MEKQLENGVWRESRRPMVAAIVLVGLVTGCSGGMNPRGWLGGDSKGQTSAESVYYAGVGDLTVRDAPGTSAKIVGHLSLHQRVLRSEVSKGYARVRTEDSSLKGWVVNAKLIWKLPADEAGSQVPAPATERPVEAEPPAVSEQAPEVAVPEEPPPPAEDGSSVFDPY